MFRYLANAVTLLGFWVLLVLTGCASTQPVPYAGLKSSSQLQPNKGDDADHVPYRFSRPTHWQKYATAIVEPVVIYQGADSQFEEISDDDKAVLATYMQSRFEDRLKTRFKLVTQPAPDTLRICLTLTGAKTTTRGLSTFTRFDLGGGPYNIVQSIRGKEGTFTGSVSYAVEILDATSGTLLDAYVTKQYPNALNIGASLGLLDASKVGIEKGADDLVAKLH